MTLLFQCEKCLNDYVIDKVQVKLLMAHSSHSTLLSECENIDPRLILANGAFIALAASKVRGMTQKSTMRRYAKSQIHFLLGGAGRSYVVGFGRNPPKNPHHRAR